MEDETKQPGPGDPNDPATTLDTTPETTPASEPKRGKKAAKDAEPRPTTTITPGLITATWE